MSAFRFCTWCRGRGNGCICCEKEQAKWLAKRDAEYDRQFPNGPVPMFTARRDSPIDMAALSHAFHVDRLRDAFGPGGGGMETIERLASEARMMQQENQELEQSE